MKNKNKIEEQLIDESVESSRQNTKRNLGKKITASKYQHIWDTYSHSPIPTLILSREGKIVEYNSAMRKLTGYSHKEVPDINAWMPKIYPDEEYRNKVIEISRKSRQREIDVKRDTFTITKKSGEERIIQFSVYDMFLEEKPSDLQIVQGEDITERLKIEEELEKYRRHLEVLVEKRTVELKKINEKLHQKVTERKRAEETLRKSEKRYRGLYESSLEGIASADMDGNFLECNQAFTDMLGYTKEEMHNLTFRDITPSQWHDLDAKFYTEQMIPQGYSDLYEKEYIRKDGTVFPVSLRGWFIEDEEGNRTGTWAIVRNITERKQAEESLQESQQQLSRIYDSVGDVLFYLAVEPGDCFRFLSINQEFLSATGMTEDQIVGKRIEDVIPEPSVRMVRDNYKKAIEENRVIRWEETSEYPAGVKVGSVSIAPFFDDNGICTHLIGSVQDITERKQAEEEIKASLKEKEVLLQEVHHRVKNNLQVISSLLSLQSQHSKSKKLTELLKASENRIKSMSLVHEKLYASEDLTKINFMEYITALTNRLVRSHESFPGKIALKIDVADISLEIGPAIHCGLIINELVSNSIRHAFPGEKKGEIQIAFRPVDGKGIELVVSDNGVGMPKDMDFRKTKTLGMHIVTLLAEKQLQGKITLDRAKGTKYRIQFKMK